MSTAAPRRPASVPEWRQILSVTRLEMTSYLRSWGGLLFVLLMPTALLLIALGVWYPTEARQITVPDMAVMSVLASGLFSIGVAVTEQRKDGTLKTYLSSPLRARTYLAGQVLDRVVVTFTGNIVMLLVAWLAFDITSTGSLLLYLVMATLSLATMLSFGFLLASRFKTIETAGALSSVIFFAVMIGSGFFMDPSRFPGWLKTVVDVLPFKPIVDGMRATWSDPDLAGVGVDMLIVSTWFVVFLVGAARLFRWTPDDR
ncbi:ABC transporter permease [Rhodococcus sp. 14-2483-1-2]|uniref:ABC transporter permease n=1 Tax=Rhodococcus sp. 14-2483-1-2 TaxID=2023147 RepID=UPI000B9BBF56|nr:ABC transporter permease [Rhodococcus sp. 14-2483-1-2]OZF26175.1 hypothetical protein CH295_26530 [Rhodococcus sp. 14-2483-1-2]